MLTSNRKLLPNVKFRIGESNFPHYARIETINGQPVANFAACDGHARQIAERIVELLNTHGVAPRRRRAKPQLVKEA